MVNLSCYKYNQSPQSVTNFAQTTMIISKTSEHLLALCILQHIFIAHPWSGVFTMFVCICKVLTIYNVVQKLQQLADGYLQRPLVILLLPAFEYLFISYCFIVVAKVESCVCCLRRSSNTL